ncbi:MAG: hypothetical protein J6X49_09700 [Victivallales bacterium]|nr:hypothetical protein [Victivallales bacterium]
MEKITLDCCGNRLSCRKNENEQKGNTMRIFILLLICLGVGCHFSSENGKVDTDGMAKNKKRQVVDAKAYRFPSNAAFQMKKAIPCKGPMLLIPIARPKGPGESKPAVLDTPVEISFPFENLPSLTGYQYVVYGYSWTVGSNGFLFAFFLVGSDGSIFFMDTPDAPFGKDRDIKFFKANLSDDWRKSFTACLTEEHWGLSGFWQLPDGAPAYHWRKPEDAVPILKSFCVNHPFVSTSKEGKWERVKFPCFTPNVYCSQGVHAMPKFSANEILLLYPTIKVVNIGNDFSYNETQLAFPNGKIASHISGMEQELDKLWATGKYTILAYDRRAEKDVEDPERDSPWAPSLRTYAADKGIPLVILYGDGKDALHDDSLPKNVRQFWHGDDKSAPVYEGLPKGVTQYWQCPQCMHEQMK